MTQAYASVADVLVTRRVPTQDQAYTAAVQQQLEQAQDVITEEVGYSFLRQPEDDTETWIVNGPGGIRLHVHEGLAELSLVEIRFTTADAWIELADGDWSLEAEPDNPTIPDGEPAFHVVLDPYATYPEFPCGRNLVRLTGARGWPAITASVRDATVALARQRLGLDLTQQGGPLGPEELGGRDLAGDRWPRPTYDLIRRERKRHEACSL